MIRGRAQGWLSAGVLVVMVGTGVALRAADEAGRVRPAEKTEPSAGGAQTSAAAGRWQLSVTKAADGAPMIRATLPADQPVTSGFAQVTPQLALQYHAGRASLAVGFDTFLGSGPVEVTVRIDAMTTAETWRISNDGRAVFPAGEPLEFLNRLRTAQMFSVTVPRAKRDPLTATFSTHGLDRVIKALLAAGVKYGT